MIKAIFVFLLSFSFGANAHSEGPLHGPWWLHWNWSPLILFNLALALTFYSYGWRRMKAKALQRPMQNWRHMAFILGVFSLFMALISPVDPLSDSLAWVHMLQHTLLMMVSAPLIALGLPQYLAQWSLSLKFVRSLRKPRRFFRKKQFSVFTRPLTILFVYALTLWLWHLPLLYETALSHPIVHDLQHLSFFITSFLFWKLIFNPFRNAPLLPGVGLFYLFISSLHSMILGVLMALSPVAWYAPYVLTAPRFGLSAIEDQQIAGLIMWMPAGTTYVVAAVVLLLKLIHSTSATSFSVHKIE